MSYEYKLKIILLANHILFALGLIYANLGWLALSFVGWIMFCPARAKGGGGQTN